MAQGKSDDAVARILRLTELLHERFDRLGRDIYAGLAPTPTLRGAPGDTPGQNVNLEQCQPAETTYTPWLDDTQCFRVAVISLDPGTKVEVKWTGKDGKNYAEPALTAAGTQTKCFGPVRSVSMHAQNGDAVVTRVTCKCKKKDE